MTDIATARNEAADRLRDIIGRKIGLAGPLWEPDLDAALATERRNTVGRIMDRLHEAVLTGSRYRENRDPDINFHALMTLLADVERGQWEAVDLGLTYVQEPPVDATR